MRKIVFPRIAASLWILGALLFAFCLRSGGQTLSSISGTLDFPAAGYQEPAADRIDSLLVEYAAEIPSWVYVKRGTSMFRLRITFADSVGGQSVVLFQGCWMRGDGSKVTVVATLYTWPEMDGLHATLWVGSSLNYKQRAFYIPNTLVSGLWSIE